MPDNFPPDTRARARAKHLGSQPGYQKAEASIEATGPNIIFPIPKRIRGCYRE